MTRSLPVMAVAFALAISSITPCQAQWGGSSAGGGLLARLNKPLVPTLPGLPTASPLGLIAPRLSMLAQIGQLGGLKTQAGKPAGLVSPRISPAVALVRKPPVTRQARLMYGLTILSPRAAVLVGMLKAFSGMAAFVR